MPTFFSFYSSQNPLIGNICYVCGLMSIFVNIFSILNSQNKNISYFCWLISIFVNSYIPNFKFIPICLNILTFSNLRSELWLNSLRKTVRTNLSNTVSLEKEKIFFLFFHFEKIIMYNTYTYTYTSCKLSFENLKENLISTKNLILINIRSLTKLTLYSRWIVWIVQK